MLNAEPAKPEPNPGALAAVLHAKRSEKRVADRARIHARVLHPIDTPHRMRDPLVHRESRLLSAMAVFRLVVAAIVLHGIAIVVLALVGRFVGVSAAVQPVERVEVRIAEDPLPPRDEPPPVETQPDVEGPVQPDFAPEPKDTEPTKTSEPARTAQPAKPASTAEEPDETVPRTIGLSLESTVTGSGPDFATGTSRMGRTEKTAKDPNEARREPTGTGTGAGTGAGNRAEQPKARDTKREASRIPTRDVVFVPPKRLTPSRPPYPPTLKTQGIEGDVVVRVQIAADGSVSSVSIVQSSGHAAFDATARQAARAERFSPATRDGEAIPYSLTYSYRFRIDDK